MPKPISWRELVRRLRTVGWSGPYPGGRHPTMVKGDKAITLPNPHRGDIDWSLTKRILKQARITSEEWDKFK
jgi:predicted RNA binding protein YcfA (HicA-like mRNA interferase family)